VSDLNGEKIKKRIDKMMNLKNVKVTKTEISFMKRDIVSYILNELLKVQNYFEFKYRQLIADGFTVKSESNIDINEDNDKVEMKLIVKIIIPSDFIVELAKRRKLRMLKFHKPHTLTKQKLRQLEEFEEKMKDEMYELVEEVEESEEEEETKESSEKNKE